MSCTRANINLTACEGATFEQSFIWKTGTPATEVDLTGYTADCHIRQGIRSDTPLFTLTTENSGIVIADQETDTGKYTFNISDSDMQDVCASHNVVQGVYDLMLTSPGGTVRLHQYGTFTINPAVTRPW